MKVMKKRISLGNVKAYHFPWILIAVLIILLTSGILLYWLNAMTLTSLAVWILGLVVIGLLLVFGTGVAQRDAFINGFRNGRDGVKKGKKKS